MTWLTIGRIITQKQKTRVRDIPFCFMGSISAELVVDDHKGKKILTCYLTLKWIKCCQKVGNTKMIANSEVLPIR